MLIMHACMACTATAARAVMGLLASGGGGAHNARRMHAATAAHAGCCTLTHVPLAAAQFCIASMKDDWLGVIGADS